MKVQCNKYNKCGNSSCSHAKPHKYKTTDIDFLDDCKNSIFCDEYIHECDTKTIRKQKIENLNSIIEI